jgi:hypothetical protein
MSIRGLDAWLTREDPALFVQCRECGKSGGYASDLPEDEDPANWTCPRCSDPDREREERADR